jgi:hypothetical protein
MPAKPASAALSGDYVVFDGRGALAVPGLRAVIRQPQPDPHVCSTADARRALGRSEPRRVATYRAFEAAARENGPMVVIPEKTRIAFQLRMSFAAVTLRKRWVDAHVVLARRLENARFRRIETFSTRNHLHEFRLEGPEEVDDEVARWLAEAYRVGRRDHLRERTSDDR